MEQIVRDFGEENTDALKECDEVLRAGVEANFDASATARGEAWPARKDPTPKHPLLILEGNLKQSATTEEGQISDGKTLTRIMPRGASGTSLAGIRRHEFGDEEILGKDWIQARPYYGVSSQAADDCAEIVADHLAEQVASLLL
jgi:phage gpG-like protein